MEGFCKTLGHIWLGLGTIGSIVIANTNGRVVEDLGRFGYDLERNWLLTIVWFVASMFCVITIAILFYAMAEILDTLDSVRYNTEKVDSAVNSISKSDKMSSKSGYWTCQKCGRENTFYTGTCACGELKP